MTISFWLILLAVFSYGLLQTSIEQWCSAPAEQMLENSRAIADQYYAEARHIRVGARSRRVRVARFPGPAATTAMPTAGAPVPLSQVRLTKVRGSFRRRSDA